MKKSKFPFLPLLLVALISIASTTGSADKEEKPGRKPAGGITDSIIVDYAMLKNKFGKNKEMPASYEKQILIALSYFPELANAKIKFQVKKSSKGIISTRPSIGSLLRKSTKRSYIVIIYDSIEGRTLPAFSNCDVSGQVGILGHELCHIVDFNHRTGLSLVGLGIAHISKRYIDRYEYKTDSMNIERGLGYQLIAWKEYLYKGFDAMRRKHPVPSQKSVTHKRYMSIEEVRGVMARSKLYQEER